MFTDINNLTQSIGLRQKVWAFVFIYCVTITRNKSLLQRT